MIVTKNLIVLPLLPRQLSDYLDRRGVRNEEVDFINDMLESLSKANEDNYFFHTFWVAIGKESEHVLAELVLKGEPVNGEVEIGYESFKPGTMTEMVEAVCCWAQVQKITLKAIAENAASARVLEKNGFVNENNIYIKYV